MKPAILVGVDGSPSSVAAVEWAARTAAHHNVPLGLVHVLAPQVVMTFPETPMPPGYTEWQREQGERYLRDAVSRAEALAPSSRSRRRPSSARRCRRWWT